MIKIDATSRPSIKKQLKRALKRTFLAQISNLLQHYGKGNHFSLIERKSELKCVTYLYQYLTNKRKTYTNAFRLPKDYCRINQ